jgi:hypothetical protein
MREDGLCLVHIPKTAGTALRTALLEALGPINCYFVATKAEIVEFERNVATRSNLRAVGGHLRLSRVIEANKLLGGHWPIVTVLRDPLRRLISEFNYLTSSNHTEHEQFRGLSFDTFLRVGNRGPVGICGWLAESGTHDEALTRLAAAKVAVFSTSRYRRLLAELSTYLGTSLRHARVHVGVASLPIDLSGIKNAFDWLREDYLIYLEFLAGGLRTWIQTEPRRVVRETVPRIASRADALRRSLLRDSSSAETVIRWQQQCTEIARDADQQFLLNWRERATHSALSRFLRSSPRSS